MLMFSQDTPLQRKSTTATCSPLLPPSSPPSLKMPSLVSSPIVYPPSSSPVTKRPLPTKAAARKPRTVGGFLEDDSDDENGNEILEPALKRRMLSRQQSPSSGAVRTSESTDSSYGNSMLEDAPRVNRPRTIGGFVIDDDGDETELPILAEKASEPAEMSEPVGVTQIQQAAAHS